jgi:hypothetical protein
MAVTVTSTMPPRGKHVHIVGWPTTDADLMGPAVAFAVWSTGEITPIVQFGSVLATFPAFEAKPLKLDDAWWALHDGPDGASLARDAARLGLRRELLRHTTGTPGYEEAARKLGLRRLDADRVDTSDEPTTDAGIDGMADRSAQARADQ